MEYKGRLYAKINGKYIECTETVQDLEDKIKYLESRVNKLNNERIHQQIEIAELKKEFNP